MHRSDGIIWLTGQKAEELSCHLTLLQLPDRGPFCADAGEAGERAILAEGKPDRVVAGRAGSGINLGEAGEGNETAMLHVEPSAPMGRADIADVRHARVRAFSGQIDGGCRHAPSGCGEGPVTIWATTDDWRGIVREDAGS